MAEAGEAVRSLGPAVSVPGRESVAPLTELYTPETRHSHLGLLCWLVGFSLLHLWTDSKGNLMGGR